MGAEKAEGAERRHGFAGVTRAGRLDHARPAVDGGIADGPKAVSSLGSADIDAIQRTSSPRREGLPE